LDLILYITNDQKLRRTIIYFIIGILIIIFLGLYLTGVIYAPMPPVSEISQMQNALAIARQSNAPEFAEKDFLECLELYDSAMNEWKLQNEKWILRRDYSKLRLQVRNATQCADEASSKAVQTTGSLEEYIDRNIEELKQRDSAFRTRFKHFPFNENILKEHSTAHLRLLEGIEASKRGNLSTSFNDLIQAETGFYNIEREVDHILKSYFKSYDQWEKWLKQTLRTSKMNNSIAIVIDKMAHKCFLYKNGNMVKQYDAELSINWMGYKNYEGDNATPEGIYKITRMLDKGQTKFHKALLINYPNEADKKRYAQALRSGAIPKSVGIGNFIEIHGDGGRGKDWTNGCIALANKDMDHLFSMVNTGVPVTIVGSTVPLDQLF